MNRLLALCLAFVSCAGYAASYATQPIRLLVGYSPGGPNDTQARLIGQRLAANLGQPVVVDNRAGADGIIAATAVARAEPDGYTLILVSAGHAISHNFHRSMPVHPIKDFQPIIQLSTSPFVLVTHPSLKAQSVQELIAMARARPGELIYGSSGLGSSLHLAAALFNGMAGISMVHVPYKGGAPATADLLAGQTQLMFNNVVSSVPHVRSKKLRALGVTSAERWSVFPDTPAIAESLPGYEVSAWYGILGPAKMPSELVQRLNSEIADALAAPEIREKMSGMGLQVVGGSPERLEKHIRSEYEKWIKVVREAGLRTD